VSCELRMSGLRCLLARRMVQQRQCSCTWQALNKTALQALEQDVEQVPLLGCDSGRRVGIWLYDL
jgi:hypothetical protein